MKRAEILAAITDLAGDDIIRRQAAAHTLEQLPVGYLEDHPLPRGKVAPMLPKLAKLLFNDSSDVVKEWCAQLIGESQIRLREFLPPLIATLSSRNDRVLMSAIWALGGYKDRAAPAIDALMNLTTHLNREVRWRAVWALAEIRPKGKRYAERFAELFGDDDSLVRGYAVLAFANATEPSPWAVAQLQKLETDEDSMPRLHAIRILSDWTAQKYAQPE